MESCQLRDLILDRHRSNAPSMYHRNNNKVLIDGIWVTPGIYIMSGGYFGFDKVFSNKDHHPLWINITYVTAFGHNMPPIAKPATRRLHCKDPRVVKNYLSVNERFVFKNRLLEHTKALEAKASHLLPANL